MSFLVGLLSFLMLIISLFLILLVMIQRGRGGGLAGAFGGMGGQSAFGTRAGDTFTRVTIVFAVIWVLLAGGLGIAMRGLSAARDSGENSLFKGAAAAEAEGDDSTGAAAPVKTATEVTGDAANAAPAAADSATAPAAQEKAEPAQPAAEAPENAISDRRIGPPLKRRKIHPNRKVLLNQPRRLLPDQREVSALILSFSWWACVCRGMSFGLTEDRPTVLIP
jgi:preprotein translocase subunit SecG